MGFGELRALTLETNLWAHGVDVTLRATMSDPAIETTGIWLTNETPEALDGLTRGGLAQFRGWREVRRVLAIARADSDRVPTGTRLLAPESEGGEVKAWIVDTVVGKRADHTRVIVRPDPEGV